MENKWISSIDKIATGIPGFDLISQGGVAKGRTTIITGSSGSGKTVFACQFLAEGVLQFDEPGIFITFEESPLDIRRNMKGFGWDIEELEDNKQLAFVDASPEPGESHVVNGEYDFGALLARIEYAINEIGAKRVAMDSLGAILAQFNDIGMVRQELFRINSALKQLQVTSIMTAERYDEYGSISRHGVEEYVADNVVILRNVLESEKRRRTIEILKFRGTSHIKGETPFTIIPNHGVVLIPLTSIELRQRSSSVRMSSGNKTLDQMCGGGFYRDSIILISGATGTGKTLAVTEFVGKTEDENSKSLFFAFEESREQLFRNASGWGADFEEMEKQGRLKVVCEYPEFASLEDHLIRMREMIEEFQPDRVAIDSLSALERISTMKSFREFVIGLTSFIKHKQIAGLFSSTTPSLLGGISVSDSNISTITDSIILLRYVEMYGEMRRGIMVLKMRGSMHEKNIREFSIDDEGMHIGKPFRNVSGILAGHPTQHTEGELGRLNEIFDPPPEA